MRPIIALIIFLIAATAPAGAAEKFKPGETIEGPAFAMDGDTLGLARPDGSVLSVRLWGIDAPEMSAENGHGWAARAALDDLLNKGDQVTCTVVDTDKYKRPVAICSTVKNPTDLGFWIIDVGWAVEYRKYTRPAPATVEPARPDVYAVTERRAREHRKGRWKFIYGK